MKAIKAKLMCAVAIATAFAYGPAVAQGSPSYPDKPVRIVVGYQAGGPTDTVARLVAAKLQEAFKQPFIVENKPGAGSNIASEYMAKQAADGYTLMVAAAPITMNPFLYKSLKYDVQKSFTPISMLMSAPVILGVNTKVPAKNLEELIALAKKQPGGLTYGSSGTGGTVHLAAEMLRQRTNINVLHVPYKGAAPALNDLMAGHVTMAFMTSVSHIPHLKSGNPRPIAVASSQRLPQLPDVPTMAEAGLAGFEVDSWNGLFAPAGTPPDIIKRLQDETIKAVKDPVVREKLIAQGAVPAGTTSEEFGAHIAKEVSHWSSFLKTANISMD